MSFIGKCSVSIGGSMIYWLWSFSVYHELQAYYLGWYAPKYVWFTLGWNDNGWWAVNYHGNSSCTAEMILKVLNGSLIYISESTLVSDVNDTTFSGLVNIETTS